MDPLTVDPDLARGRGRLNISASQSRVRCSNERRLRICLTVLGLVFILGLTRCSSPTDPPAPPSGGKEFVLSFDEFVEAVAPVLNEFGCNATGDCHGGGIRGTFELSPSDAQDFAFDFEQTSLQVFPFDLERSPILTRPLDQEAGGERHGSEPFATTEDPGYVTIRSWVYGGMFQ